MPSSVPSPVAAAVGLVPAVLGHARRLPYKAVKAPVIAVSSALQAVESAKREYDELVELGERVLARLWGSSAPQATNGDTGLVGTAAAGLQRVEDTLSTTAERTLEQVGQVLEEIPGTTGPADDQDDQDAPHEAAAEDLGRTEGLPRADDLADAADLALAADLVGVADLAGAGGLTGVADLTDAEGPAEAEAPKGQPTPKATEPDSSRVDTAATPDVVRTVEQVSAAVAVEPVDTHADLPLPDYDHMTLGSLRGRLRSLDVDQLLVLRTYEKAHANRLPVVTMLDNRIAKLAATGGSPTATGATGTPHVEPEPHRAGRREGKGGRVAATPKAPPPHTKVRLT